MTPLWLSLLAAAVVLVCMWPGLRLARGWHIPRAARLLAMGAGIGYGLLGRLLFGLSYAAWRPALPAWFTSSFAVMSLSFLFLMPVVIGFLDQSGPDPALRFAPWRRAFFAPMLPVLVMLGLMALLSIEGVLCMVMALPIFLILAGIGGCLGLLSRPKEHQALLVDLFQLFEPFLRRPELLAGWLRIGAYPRIVAVLG